MDYLKKSTGKIVSLIVILSTFLRHNKSKFDIHRTLMNSYALSTRRGTNWQTDKGSHYGPPRVNMASKILKISWWFSPVIKSKNTEEISIFFFREGKIVAFGQNIYPSTEILYEKLTESHSQTSLNQPSYPSSVKRSWNMVILNFKESFKLF